MSEQWYCLVGEREYGPFPIQQLQEFVQQGRLIKESYVRLATSDQWQLAGQVPGLFSPSPTRTQETPLAGPLSRPPGPSRVQETPLAGPAARPGGPVPARPQERPLMGPAPTPRAPAPVHPQETPLVGPGPRPAMTAPARPPAGPAPRLPAAPAVPTASAAPVVPNMPTVGGPLNISRPMAPRTEVPLSSGYPLPNTPAVPTRPTAPTPSPTPQPAWPTQVPAAAPWSQPAPAPQPNSLPLGMPVSPAVSMPTAMQIPQAPIGVPIANPLDTPLAVPLSAESTHEASAAAERSGLRRKRAKANSQQLLFIVCGGVLGVVILGLIIVLALNQPRKGAPKEPPPTSASKKNTKTKAGHTDSAAGSKTGALPIPNVNTWFRVPKDRMVMKNVLVMYVNSAWYEPGRRKLKVAVRILNSSKAGTLDYHPYAGHLQASDPYAPILIDDRGNRLAAQAGTLNGSPAPATYQIKGEQWATEQLTFDLPPFQVSHVRLILPLGVFGYKSYAGFEIPRAAIQDQEPRGGFDVSPGAEDKPPPLNAGGGSDVDQSILGGGAPTAGKDVPTELPRINFVKPAEVKPIPGEKPNAEAKPNPKQGAGEKEDLQRMIEDEQPVEAPKPAEKTPAPAEK